MKNNLFVLFVLVCFLFVLVCSLGFFCGRGSGGGKGGVGGEGGSGGGRSGYYIMVKAVALRVAD